MKLEQDVCNGSKREQLYKCGWLWQTGHDAKTKRKGGGGMREGWEYKKLGDSCVIEYGTRVVQKKDGGTIYPVYGGGGETFRMDKYNRENCLVVARFAMSRTCVRYVTGKFFLNDSGLSINAGKELLQSYLNHHILHLNDDIYNLGKGAAQRNLDVKSLRNLIIAIPPLSTQLSIVSALDKINELIRLKKEQLKDYDNLAQSIFYEMFGDPVVNEKGWGIKKLGNFCEIGTGSTPSRKNKEYYEGSISWVKSTEVSNCVIDSTEEHISEIAIAETNCTIYPKGTILIAMYGQGKTRGQIAILNIEATTNQAVAAILPSELCDKLFLYYCLHLMYENIRSMARGGNQANLNLAIVRSINIILPPLPLQQLFAQRIELIEKQKAEIQSTIADLETLLASRMQYWFG